MADDGDEGWGGEPEEVGGGDGGGEGADIFLAVLWQACQLRVVGFV